MDYEIKWCAKCERYLPRTAEYFQRDSGRRGGYRYNCKECLLRAEHAKHPPRSSVVKVIESHKKCPRCGEIKEATLEYFGPHTKVKSGLNSQCRTCDYHRYRGYALANPDKRRESSIKFKKRNPQKLREYNLRYTTLKRHLPFDFTDIKWRSSLEYFNHSCAVCERPLNGLFHTAARDHWIPITSPDCPGTVATNIVPLCHGQGGCNNSKKDKLPEVWLIDTYGVKKGKQILNRINEYFESVA